MATITSHPLSPTEAKVCGEFLRAFAECGSTIQALVLEMCEILNDPSATEDEAQLAVDTLVEALFPGQSADTLEATNSALQSAEGRQERDRSNRHQEAFASRVRELMRSQQMTQEKLAAAIGVSQPAVANILGRNCRPQQRTVAKIAEALGVHPDELWRE